MLNLSSPARLLTLACCLLCVRIAGAQSERPRLARDKDPNDWEAYYDLGVETLPHSVRDAEAAFAWAGHLRPDRAEPLYALWLTFWARDLDRFQRYLRDDEKTLRDPQVIRADSLRLRAFQRNPFVHQGLLVFLYDQLPGSWQDDPVTRGWLHLGQAQLPQALSLFGGAIKRDPHKYAYLRFVRASAFVNSGRPDSAAAEIAALLAELRAEDAKKLGNGYQSKEMLEYATGLLHLQARRGAAAREAFGRSAVENAAFAPAHAMLGELATASRDTATALAELALATETDPNDPLYAISRGKALRVAHRDREAIEQFQKAIVLEPYYAAPYLLIASALDDSGDKAGAAEAYTRFLSRAALADPQRAEAERKLQALKR